MHLLSGSIASLERVKRSSDNRIVAYSEITIWLTLAVNRDTGGLAWISTAHN